MIGFDDASRFTLPSRPALPPMPKGKPIGIKTASWRIPNGIHVEFWYDFTGGGKGPWVKYASLDDTLPGHCNGGSIIGSPKNMQMF